MSNFGGYLRQSTSVKVPLGPLVDASNGYDLEGSVAFGSSDCLLIKENASAIVNISSNTFSAHLGGGLYNVTLTTSDTDTVGRLSVVAYDAAHRPYRVDFQVLDPIIYDSLYAEADTDYLPVNLKEIDDDATAASNLAIAAGGMQQVTVQSGSTTTKIKTNLTEATNSHYNGRQVLFTSGALEFQMATIEGYSGSAKEITVTGLTEAPAVNDTFIIV